jgi:membrane-bound lytic murein transglycosylase D
MADRACFFVAAGCLFSVLAPGSIAPVAADSHPLVPEAVEYFVVPRSEEDALLDLGLQSLTVDPLVDGFDATGAAPEPAPSMAMPYGAFPDEWATPAVEPPTRRSEAPAPMPQAPPQPQPQPSPEVVSDGPAYPVVVTPQVEAFLERFTTTRREVITLWLSRSRQYLGMIREVFRKHGLPEDLAFVAMIESGFNPIAVSHAGAKGLWQFMADTARRYGLRVDQWVDERYDPEKSTGAAAAYLKDLYRQFGSWALAKAAYNAGEMKVVQAIRGVGSSDFWALASSRFLKTETKEFVPAIHAATLIGRDPGRFGFDPPALAPVDVETVKVAPVTNLTRIASGAGIPVDTLRSLNPVLVRGITPPGASFDLRVPPGSRRAVQAALARPAKKTVARTRKGGAAVESRVASGSGIHVVKPRETVTSIARRHGVSVSDVLRWNRMSAADLLRPGDRLVIGETRVAERVARGR